MRNDDVRDLILQLNRLQLQQTELLIRLERAVNNKAALHGESKQEVAEPKVFEIGNRVIVANPNLFQANKGTITKIGQKRITVTSESGQKILRAPKNLSHQNERR